MSLRVNDNNPTRQMELENLLGLYTPATGRVTMIHEGLAQYDPTRGGDRSVVSEQIYQNLKTDLVIVYGETPFRELTEIDWYRRYHGHRNFRYIALGEPSVRVCAIAVLIQLYFVTDDPAEKENISAGLWRCSHPPGELRLTP